MLRAPAINKTLPFDAKATQGHEETAALLASLSVSPTPQTAAAQDDALLRAAAVEPPPDLPPYIVHLVAEGDTVGTIAAHYGVEEQYIIANNAEIRDSDFLSLGQSLIIPAGNGILHEVRYGETLSDIAARYDVDVEAIAGFGSNDIATADDITEAQLVFVPGGAPPVFVPDPLAEPFPDDAAGDDPTAEVTPEPSDDDDASEDDDSSSGGGIVRSGPSSSAGLIWPVSGPISSYYGPSHPLGIDIDGFNLGGAGIAAATSGTVVFAGGNACCSYGLYVVVVSPEGIETLYAHLSSISVSQGQAVAQGEQVGVIGDTGYSTGVHLHFEVIDNGARVNPLNYLP